MEHPGFFFFLSPALHDSPNQYREWPQEQNWMWPLKQYMLPWFLWVWQIPKDLHSSVFWDYFPHSKKIFPTWLVPLSTKIVPFYQVLSLITFTFLTMCKIIATSQSHSLNRIRGHLILLLQQILPYTAPACSGCCQVQPNVTLPLIKNISDESKSCKNKTCENTRINTGKFIYKLGIGKIFVNRH